MSPIDQLKSVLCDPDGKCCITGSKEDRAIVDRALAALAQPEQEPLTNAHRKSYQAGHNAGVAHHKQATKREWVDLTEADIDLIDDAPLGDDSKGWSTYDFARAIQAKSKELNHE